MWAFVGYVLHAMRLFIAVTPPAEIRDLVVKTYSEIERARWVRKEQLHVTLRFLGELEEEAAASVREALRAIAAPHLTLALKRAGTFGRPARVLWCGLDPEEEICALASEIDRIVVQAGLTEADKPFAPHLTVARFKNSPPVMIRSWLEQHRAFETPPFSVDAFTLYQSKLSSSGAEHFPLEIYPLGART
jgi:RNA 2',3'-cyclic 3'-phosphodiesterase